MYFSKNKNILIHSIDGKTTYVNDLEDLRRGYLVFKDEVEQEAFEDCFDDCKDPAIESVLIDDGVMMTTVKYSIVCGDKKFELQNVSSNDDNRFAVLKDFTTFIYDEQQDAESASGSIQKHLAAHSISISQIRGELESLQAQLQLQNGVIRNTDNKVFQILMFVAASVVGAGCSYFYNL